MNTISTVLCDFDGVLCFDRFYGSALQPEYTEVADWIQKEIHESNKELVRSWMRGEMSSDDVNKMIAEQTGIKLKVLQERFYQSVQAMKLDQNVLEVITTLKQAGRKVALVTDNMDVFTEISIKNLQLDKYFDVIVNSANYGVLKKEANGKLFDIALKKVREKNIKNSLVIDNQPEVIEFFQNKGGQGYLYKNFDEFNTWVNKNLLT